jgi:hypothetical protein
MEEKKQEKDKKEKKKTSQPKSWFEAMKKSKQGLEW